MYRGEARKTSKEHEEGNRGPNRRAETRERKSHSYHHGAVPYSESAHDGMQGLLYATGLLAYIDVWPYDL